jgi:hypothetical protein
MAVKLIAPRKPTAMAVVQSFVLGFGSLTVLTWLLWRHPEFGPPIVAGFGLAVVAAALGTVIGFGLIAYRWFNRSR